ncbi:hira (nucleomorph) [Chroomonas mesostigmatica CCMP1168]|uniref:Hira n=1 Tax=Chroomonas mesostigmatica CCMP1168 TaxID=1195612 RepID=J7G9R0_9CRYP|nr:hira [Chroomonas mesostigmatica CCMP1168]
MILKPLKWIYHGKTKKNRTTIFSIDIQPFGSFFVTSGQDSVIKIWLNNFHYSNFLPDKPTTFKKKIKLNYSKYQKKSPIFSLEPHQGSVSIVRWASHGLLLASGGDNGYLIVYERIRNPTKKTMWRILEIFKKHNGDIIDLAWCPKGSFIGTVALDNDIFIWCINKKCIFVKLSSYLIWVKGICWDISGKFLITQTDNQKIVIWDTAKWKIFKILFLKKKKSNQKINLFNRSCWSSCGNNIMICNVTSKKKSSVFIFNRLDEFTNCFFITGQKFLSKTIRSSHRLYRKKNSTKIFSLFSMGSTKGGIAIWANFLSQTLINIKKIRKSQILDLSWSTNGYDLLVCFLTGDVVMVNFRPEEIGNILNLNEHAKSIGSIALKQKKKKKKKSKVILKFLIKKINLSKILKREINDYAQTTLKNKNIEFFLKNKNKIIFEKFLKLWNRDIEKKIEKNFKKKYTCQSFRYLLNVFLLSSFRKKTKKFSILKHLPTNKSRLNFFSCPLFSSQSGKFFFFLLSKKKKILFKMKKKKKEKKFKFSGKVCSIILQKSLIKILDCLGNILIINIFELNRVFFYEQIRAHRNIFSIHDLMRDSSFIYCSGLLALCSISL